MRLFDDFEDGDTTEWTTNVNWTAVSDRVYSGSYSAYEYLNESSTYTLASRDFGSEVDAVELYWQETSGSQGGAYELYDSGGNRVAGGGTENPQWIYIDGGSAGYLYGGDGYGRWVRLHFAIDYDNNEYTVTFEDLQSGTTKSVTAAMESTGQVTGLRVVNTDSEGEFAARDAGGDGASTYEMWTDNIHISPIALKRFSTLDGDGSLTNARMAAASRQSAASADAMLSNNRATTSPRHSLLDGGGSLTNVRGAIEKSRRGAVDADTELTTTAIFREVFGEELTRDLEWDFSQVEQGWVSEWMQKYPAPGHGSMALYVEGRLSNPPVRVIVEFDADGDGQPENRSRVATIDSTSEVAVYPSLSGDEGRYRVIIRDLTPQDVFAAVTFGTTHT